MDCIDHYTTLSAIDYQTQVQCPTLAVYIHCSTSWHTNHKRTLGWQKQGRNGYFQHEKGALKITVTNGIFGPKQGAKG